MVSAVSLFEGFALAIRASLLSGMVIFLRLGALILNFADAKCAVSHSRRELILLRGTWTMMASPCFEA